LGCQNTPLEAPAGEKPWVIFAEKVVTLGLILSSRFDPYSGGIGGLVRTSPSLCSPAVAGHCKGHMGFAGRVRGLPSA